MNIVHLLPSNSNVCGGIKVHYQLADIEREMGHTSVIAFPKKEDFPNWFIHDNAYEKTYDNIKNNLLSFNNENSIVIGWEDLQVLNDFPIKKKIAYIQGESLFDRTQINLFCNINYWFSGYWNSTALSPYCSGPIVKPYLDFLQFYPGFPFLNYSDEKIFNVLVLARKKGREKWMEVEKYLGDLVTRYKVNYFEDAHEYVYAQALRQSDILFTHSYPEGLGLTGLEAMASKVLVVGYSGGGGTDYMKNNINCFFTEDGNAEGVAEILRSLLEMRFEKLKEIVTNGFVTASYYSKLRTKGGLVRALNLL